MANICTSRHDPVMFTIKRFNVADSEKSHSISVSAPAKHKSFLSKLNKAAKKRLEERTRHGKTKNNKKSEKSKQRKKHKSPKKKKGKKSDNGKKRKDMTKASTKGAGTDSDIRGEAVLGERNETPQKRRRAEVDSDPDDKVTESIGASLLCARNLLQGWKTRNFMKKNAVIDHKTSIPNSAETSPSAQVIDAQRCVELVSLATRT